MSQERGSFRRRLFGGFDRTDVINYIENIAGQRNKYQAEAQKSAVEADELRSKLDSLTVELQENNAKQDSLRNELRGAQDELETVKGQLERSNKELAAKSAQYENDITAAQNALNDAIAKGEQQRLEAINSASQIIAELRAKYENNMSAMSTAFTEAEAAFAKLSANKEN